MRLVDADQIDYHYLPISVLSDVYITKAEIDAMPTVEAEPIRHAKWKYTALDTFRKYKVVCPFCKANYVDNYDGYIESEDFNYCPNCGAKMNGKE